MQSLWREVDQRETSHERKTQDEMGLREERDRSRDRDRQSKRRANLSVQHRQSENQREREWERERERERQPSPISQFIPPIIPSFPQLMISTICAPEYGVDLLLRQVARGAEDGQGEDGVIWTRVRRLSLKLCERGGLNRGSQHRVGGNGRARIALVSRDLALLAGTHSA